jgi:hypothetical protein
LLVVTTLTNERTQPFRTTLLTSNNNVMGKANKYADKIVKIALKQARNATAAAIVDALGGGGVASLLNWAFSAGDAQEMYDLFEFLVDELGGKAKAEAFVAKKLKAAGL